MNNSIHIRKLLDQWTILLQNGEKMCKKKIEKRPGGLNSRIKRTTGKPIIFDANTYEAQQKIQKTLCMELPHLSHIIRSNPEIMNGYAWLCKDFIELYFLHFRLVVAKIRKAVDK